MNRTPTRMFRAATALAVVSLLAGCLATPAQHARRAQELREPQLQYQMEQYKKAAAEAEQRSRADPKNADYWQAIDERARKNFGVQDQHEHTTVTIAVSWNGICAERVLVRASFLPRPPGYQVTESARVHAAIGRAMESRCAQASEVMIQDVGSRAQVAVRKQDSWKAAVSSSLQAACEQPGVAGFKARRDVFNPRTNTPAFEAVAGCLALAENYEYTGTIFVDATSPTFFSGKFWLQPPKDDSVAHRPKWLGKGYWYSYGDAHLGEVLSRCRSSRDGYARWGSFTITIKDNAVIDMGFCDGENPAVNADHGYSSVEWNPYMGDTCRALYLPASACVGTAEQFYQRFSPPLLTLIPPDPAKASERAEREKRAREGAKGRL